MQVQKTVIANYVLEAYVQPENGGDCPTGYTLRESQCYPCHPGQFKGIMEMACVPCPQDYYGDLYGLTECFRCPRGTYTNTGASTLNSCKGTF
ncbi:signal peptide, CUB and EGF-like domain-containing protein 1 [Limulus polyphemus]|uniref:Signal peptide, CUB and EGF-like domain-containing protein 1 n=1 Tax=Limulus polyphemus TaxID=6850 RepID=A0ABM1RZE5_LIMPO|nr:signal peptide, CUB and EGF-like domain-containing protein 1 [Limulus polyphemus]